MDGEALGEGSDVGDKATNKAMTDAYKYFLRQLFMIAGGADPDRTSSEELARAAKSKNQPPQNRGQSKPSSGKPEKPIAQRFTDALGYIAKLSDQAAIGKAYQEAKKIGFDKDQMAKIANACATRATLLYIAAVGKAADLEAVEAIQKAAEVDKLGTDNLGKIRAAAEKRQAAIVGDSGSGDDGQTHTDDEPEPLNF
jgi:hypothetical protein